MHERDQAEREAIIAARLMEVTTRFGDRLGDEGLDQVREGIAKLYEAARLLRACPLTNADEFDFVYGPEEG